MAIPSRLRPVALLLSFAALAACGPIVNIGEQPTAEVFRLQPLTESVAQPPHEGWTILVDEPSASGGLDINRIAVFTGPLELKFLADARWSQRLPNMVQALLVDSLERGAGAMALTNNSPAVSAPYALATEVRDFEADVSDADAPNVTVRIAFTVLHRPSSRVIGYRVISAEADAASDSGPDLAQAFNQANLQVLRDVVTWATGSITRDESSRTNAP